MKHTKILSLLLLLCPLSLMAQEVMSLEQCQQRALQNNIRIKQANQELLMARNTRDAARTNYLPTVSAQAMMLNSSEDLVKIDMPTIPGLGSLGTMSMVNDVQTAGITAMLPIYAGGQIHRSNQLADIGVEVKQLQLSQNENEVRFTTAQYYWQIVMLKGKLATLDQVDLQLAELQRVVKKSVDQGVALQNDLLQVNLKQNEMRSSRLQVNDAIYISRMLLAQYMGMGLDSVEVTEIGEYALPPSPASLFVSPEMAVTEMPEYHLLERNVKAQKLQQRITLGKNLPTLAIGGGYSYFNLMDKDQQQWLGFATLSVPISSWLGGSREIRRQRIAVEKAQLSLKDNTELLQLQMHNKWNKVKETYQQISIALESIGQATENLRIQNIQYEAGIITMTDLLDAQTLYQRSRDQFVDAYTAHQTARAEYLKAIGK